MKKLFIIFTTLLVLAIISLPNQVLAQTLEPLTISNNNQSWLDSLQSNNLAIKTFDSQMILSNEDKHGRLAVKELLTVQVNSANRNHGIERALPLTWSDRRTPLRINSVNWTNNNQLVKAPYSTYKSANNLVVRIGDAEKYLNSGEYQFEIAYTYDNVIDKTSEVEQLYWNINGTDWRIASGLVTSRLVLDIDGASVEDTACFTGQAGSTLSDCTINKTGSEVVTAANNNLLPYENLTIKVQLANTNLSNYTTIDYILDFGPALLIAQLMSGLLLMYVIYLVVYWIKYGRDPKGKIIARQYIEPKNIEPYDVPYLVGFSNNNKMLSSLIINLCRKKVLKIIQEQQPSKLPFGKKKSFLIEFVQNNKTSSDIEKLFVTKIFGNQPKSGDSINLDDQRVTIQDFITKNLNKSKTRLQQVGLVEKSSSSKSSLIVVIGLVLLTSIVVSFFVGLDSVTGLRGLIVITMLAIPIVASALGLLSIIWFIGAMRRRTMQGVELQKYLLGLKEYMQMAESERLQFSQGVDRTENTDKPTFTYDFWERLLPWAIVFGLEKSWSKAFADILEKTPPNWYQSSIPFSTIPFIDQFNRSMQSYNDYSQSVSATSNSSSSGGGFSGGGGGGGGGGGW